MMENNKLRAQNEFDRALAGALEDAMSKKYGIDVTAQAGTFRKTNVELNGITVRFDDTNIAPTVYTDDAFQRYQNGESIETIANAMSGSVMEARAQSPAIPELTAEEAKRHVTLTLVNTERNAQLLENVPHLEIANGELSAIPRWYISEEASFVVTNEMASRLEMTPDEILAAGQRNIDAQEFEIKPMQEILRETMVGSGMDPDMVDTMIPAETEGPQLMVMTSQNRMQGSAALLSQSALDECSEKLGPGPFFILPSSLHEVICLPDDGHTNVDDLRSMVREVNSTQVAPQDYLSDEVLKYDGQKLTLASENLKINMGDIGLDDRSVHYAGMKM